MNTRPSSALPVYLSPLASALFAAAIALAVSPSDASACSCPRGSYFPLAPTDDLPTDAVVRITVRPSSVLIRPQDGGTSSPPVEVTCWPRFDDPDGSVIEVRVPVDARVERFGDEALLTLRPRVDLPALHHCLATFPDGVVGFSTGAGQWRSDAGAPQEVETLEVAVADRPVRSSTCRTSQAYARLWGAPPTLEQGWLTRVWVWSSAQPAPDAPSTYVMPWHATPCVSLWGTLCAGPVGPNIDPCLPQCVRLEHEDLLGRSVSAQTLCSVAASVVDTDQAVGGQDCTPPLRTLDCSDAGPEVDAASMDGSVADANSTDGGTRPDGHPDASPHPSSTDAGSDREALDAAVPDAHMPTPGDAGLAAIDQAPPGASRSSCTCSGSEAADAFPASPPVHLFALLAVLGRRTNAARRPAAFL